MPDPLLVRVKAPPPTTPPTEREPAVTVMMRLALTVTAPVPRFRSPGPLKPKSPFHDCAWFAVRVTAFPLALPRAPPLMIKVPEPSAETLSTFTWPAWRVKLPVKVLAPDSVMAPAPVFVKPALTLERRSAARMALPPALLAAKESAMTLPSRIVSPAP